MANARLRHVPSNPRALLLPSPPRAIPVIYTLLAPLPPAPIAPRSRPPRPSRPSRPRSEMYELIVVSPRNYFLYTPLLPAVATGTMEERCARACAGVRVGVF